MPVPEKDFPFPGKIISLEGFRTPGFSPVPSIESQILSKLDEISDKLDRLLNPHVWGPPCPKCRRDLYQFQGRWICLYCGR